MWPGYGTPAAANASLWIGAVTIPPACPCCTRRTACSIAAAAARPQRASTRPSGASIRSAGRPVDLEHRQAVGRHVGQLPEIVEAGHRQQAADDAGGAAHDGDVADDERARRLAALEQPGDDLRADAGGIAHGDRQRQRRGGSHAPLSSVAGAR